MGLLDRYLAKEILLPYAAGLLFLTQILLATQLLGQADVLFGSGASFSDVAIVLVEIMPHFLLFVLPIAFLLGAVLGVGRLAEDREVIALGAAGLSPVRLVRVPLVLGIVSAALGLWLSLFVEPASLHAARLHLNDIVKRNVAQSVHAGTFFDDIPNYTLYAGKVEKGGWRDVLIEDRSNPAASILALARAGRLEPLGEGEEMRLVLEDGQIHRDDVAGRQYVVANFRRADVPIGLGNALADRNALARNSGELTVSELRELSKVVPGRTPAEARRYAGFLQRRIATPMAMIAFGLLAVPLGASRRAGRAFGVTMTILAVIAQYLLMRTGEVLAQRGALPPVPALQIPTMVLSAAAILMIWRMARRGPGAVR